MTLLLEDIKQLLESTGYNVAYQAFKKPPLLPYIVFYETDSEYTGSDFQNHIVKTGYAVELYCKVRDQTTEAKIEQVLNFTKLSKSINYIDGEAVTVVSYDFEIIQKI